MLGAAQKIADDTASGGLGCSDWLSGAGGCTKGHQG